LASFVKSFLTYLNLIIQTLIPVYRCSLPLGLENGQVPDAAFSASSIAGASHAPARARLNIHADKKGSGAWSAKTNDDKQWLQIDFGELVRVTKVATQGRQDSNQWVTKFSLSYSMDGMHWAEYKENSVTWVSKLHIFQLHQKPNTSKQENQERTQNQNY